MVEEVQAPAFQTMEVLEALVVVEQEVRLLGVLVTHQPQRQHKVVMEVVEIIQPRTMEAVVAVELLLLVVTEQIILVVVAGTELHLQLAEAVSLTPGAAVVVLVVLRLHLMRPVELVVEVMELLVTLLVEVELQTLAVAVAAVGIVQAVLLVTEALAALAS